MLELWFNLQKCACHLSGWGQSEKNKILIHYIKINLLNRFFEASFTSLTFLPEKSGLYRIFFKNTLTYFPNVQSLDSTCYIWYVPKKFCLSVSLVKSWQKCLLVLMKSRQKCLWVLMNCRKREIFYDIILCFAFSLL